MVAANAAAQEFYAARLKEPDAQAARDYLTERNFDAAAAAQFGCGYAPDGWDTLTKHLMAKGFEAKELEAAGLSKEGRRGPIDRFHRRLLWPTATSRAMSSASERASCSTTTPCRQVRQHPRDDLYKKSNVLFGLDLAKRDIAKGHQAVVVEGYTDVMAMHLAGVKTAVASCGTAFGDEHLAMLRRLLMDDSYFRGEVIIHLRRRRGGSGGRYEGVRGRSEDGGQTFVAIAPDGMDPCELRQKSGTPRSATSWRAVLRCSSSSSNPF